MPPKTRGSKLPKASKENIDANTKSKLKTTSKLTKPTRKVLADKTNSASDDNASVLPSKPIKKLDVKDNLLVKQRPRRNRRIPSRFVECNVLQNLSNSKNTTTENELSKDLPVKIPIVLISPLKNLNASLNDSLLSSRPKRICRLPLKFEDHSISPSKFVPVQPAYASTPKIETNKELKNKRVRSKKVPESDKLTSTTDKRDVNSNNDTSKNSSADTNNNAKENLPHKKNNTKNIATKNTSPNAKTKINKKLTDKNVSFRILEDKKTTLKRDASNIDVYEFTYDPNEEPPPQKKKRKKPAKKREPKLKSVHFKNNYDVNIAKSLLALKNKVTKSSTKTVTNADKGKVPVPPVITTKSDTQTVSSNQVHIQVTSTNPTTKESIICNAENSHISQKNYNSVRVEDIALDFEDSHADVINYSPVNSPCRPITPAPQNVDTENIQTPHNADPLNLRDDLSFFDDHPVASSSMNVSTRRPEASPWRVEFGSLPIKWQVNTYVKPNMTPAFESSFINFNESKKKHVYTNMGPETNEENHLPQIYGDNTSKLKQPSIISFIKECVEKSAKKRKDKLTPVKANSLFEDLNNTSVFKKTQKQVTPKKNAQNKPAPNKDVTPPNQDMNHDTSNGSKGNSEGSKENSTENAKNSTKKKRDKDITYFGFDESENHDQENVSPTKKVDKRKLRALKPRARAVLQEINRIKEPTRAALPAAVRSKPIQSSDTVNTLFDQMKSASEPPVFPEKECIQTSETTNVTEVPVNEDSDDDDDQSVHLFEDIELVHHLKAQRKSYGKAKKVVTFRQNSISDSDVQPSDVAEENVSTDEDDLHDLTFKMPTVEPKKTTRKKKTKKQKLSKKEEQEVEAWAAGFNSMCEDIEEFDLVVE